MVTIAPVVTNPEANRVCLQLLPDVFHAVRNFWIEVIGGLPCARPWSCLLLPFQEHWFRLPLPQSHARGWASSAIPGAKPPRPIVKAGAFVSPTAEPQPAESAIYRGLPEFCRVQAEATPSSDSDIKIEVWLPLAGWNRRFLAVGNGGFAGDINYRELAGAVANGYAAAAIPTLAIQARLSMRVGRWGIQKRSSTLDIAGCMK